MLASSVSGRYKCDRWIVHTPEVPRSMSCHFLTHLYCVTRQSRPERTVFFCFFFIYSAQQLGSGGISYLQPCGASTA